MASPPDNAGFVAAAYLITGGAIGGYVVALFARARRARARSAALAARRARAGDAPAP